MRYGFFDDQHREYVILRPDTPLPWINYLGCEGYFAIISNTGGGYSFYRDARLRRLIRYRYNNAPLDVGGRFLYLREETGQGSSTAPRVWSPAWQPCRHPLDEYECRHGLGYTRIRTLLAGIESRTRYFVPLGENLEIWELTLTSHRDQPVDLSVFSAVEFCLWDAQDDATNYQRNYSIGEVETGADLAASRATPGQAVEPGMGVIYHKTEYRERRNHFAYFACSETPIGFDTQREAFLGPYRGWEAPAAVESGRMSNSIACGWQPIGAYQVKVHLQPGEQKKVIFLLGYHENAPDDKFDPPGSQVLNKRTVLPVIVRYTQAEEVEGAFEKLQAYHAGKLDRLQVTTPDAHTNRMVNIWNPYQMMGTFNLSRSASYFESGIGRGIGFRDSNQDLLGFMHLSPELARARILDLAATQLQTGGAYHQYQPLTRKGNNDIGSGFNDDSLWLVLSVAAYIKESGDWNILDVRVPYDNEDGTEEALYGHLQRSIRHTLSNLGPHGLPLIGRADWNDCLNLNCFSETPGQSFQTTTNAHGKVAESVFIAGLLVLAAKDMLSIARQRGDGQWVELLAKAAQEMGKAVAEAGWDGEWFRRAYDDFGRPVGSQECAEGQIFIEPQGICVMAGLGMEDGRAEQALDSVAARLATQHGIALLTPPFTRYYVQLGEISSYPPGYKENGSVFSHTNPWIMIAETKLGHGDRAHEYYQRINPSAREAISEIHRCEPYVYAQMIAGKAAVTPGEAKNSWLTGAAAWNYIAITQWILGIRPTFDGLEISPVFPAAWKGFDAVRLYRGVCYRIHVERSGPGNGVRLEVEGRPVEGRLIPLPPDGTDELHVTVRVS